MADPKIVIKEMIMSYSIKRLTIDFIKKIFTIDLKNEEIRFDGYLVVEKYGFLRSGAICSIQL